MTAAVGGALAAASIERDLDWDLQPTEFFTDSTACLGWIRNRTDRFSIYVTNRRRRILDCSVESQWHYVPTHDNPADIGTRPISVDELLGSSWLRGPNTIHHTPMEYWEEPNMNQRLPEQKLEDNATALNSKSVNVYKTTGTIDQPLELEGIEWKDLLASVQAEDKECTVQQATNRLILKAQQEALPT